MKFHNYSMLDRREKNKKDDVAFLGDAAVWLPEGLSVLVQMLENHCFH